MENPSETIVGYFPVFHAGYLELLDNHPGAEVAILGEDVLRSRFDYLRKDIRALSPEQAIAVISGLERTVRLIGEKSLAATLTTPNLVMPDDDVSHALATEFNVDPVYDAVFLRWDRKNTLTEEAVQPDRIVSIDGNEPIIRALYEHKEKSTNWWRHVAAVVVKDGNIVTVGHNSSVPTAYSSAIDGDPRITANRGVSIDVSIDMHAEARAIAQLAKQGSSTKQSDIFVTTFPCPNCAKLIAESGIKTCYFIEGYAMLDGQNVLKAGGVEIVKVETDPPAEDPRTLKPYPAS